MIELYEIKTEEEKKFYWEMRHKFYVGELGLFLNTDRDRFDSHCTHLIMKNENGKLIGGIRIIISHSISGLPIEYNITPGALYLEGKGAEISRLFIEEQTPISLQNLIGCLYKYSLENGLVWMIAELVDKRLSDNLQKILKNSVEYLGESYIKDPYVDTYIAKTIYQLKIDIGSISSERIFNRIQPHL